MSVHPLDSRIAENKRTMDAALTRLAATPEAKKQKSLRVLAEAMIEKAADPAGAGDELRRDSNSKVIPDEENVGRILRSDARLRGLIAYDEFSNQLILSGPIPLQPRTASDKYPRQWKDADLIATQAFIQAEYMPGIGRDKVAGAILLHATRLTVHPLRDYLAALKWDRRPRVAHILTDYFGADITKQPEHYLIHVGRAFMVSAVARVLNPGCQADSALVLEGAQGIYKSTALRTLASDTYFSDCLPHDLSHKDAKDHLRGKWIIELPELTQIKRSDVETLKAFLSRRHEMYRPPYGRSEINFPRQCVFAGTTNENEYLVDTTGNRRFWPVTCGEIDIEALARDRDQLWAEAVVLYAAGTPWHLTGEAGEAASKQAQDRVTVDPWTPMVADVLDKLMLTTADVAPGEVLSKLDIPTEQRHAKSATRVSAILRDLGWKRGNRHKTRGQLFMRPTGEGEAR